MTFDELLLGLKDIQPPPEPGWWPLAFTWWILLLSLSTGIVIWLIKSKRKRANRLHTVAHTELQKIRQQYGRDQNNSVLIQNLSRWLRQVAIAVYPEKGISAKTGRDWLKFLDESLGSAEFSEGEGKPFGDEVYRAQPQINADQLLNLCEQWLQAIKIHQLLKSKILKDPFLKSGIQKDKLLKGQSLP